GHRARLLPSPLAGRRALSQLLRRHPRPAPRRQRPLRGLGRPDLLRHLGAGADGDGVRSAEERLSGAARRRRRRGPRRARVPGGRVLRRHRRHRGLSHGLLHRPGRQRPHAPPPLRPEGL
ncbi:MAG: hypothetical protein AVDCRST_MAG45-739, partial [uncultured Solirubrobacterales bacterium]